MCKAAAVDPAAERLGDVEASTVPWCHRIQSWIEWDNSDDWGLTLGSTILNLGYIYPMINIIAI